jgi:hypothetical protein
LLGSLLHRGVMARGPKPGERRRELPQGPFRHCGAESGLQLIVEDRPGLGEDALALRGQLKQ